MPDVTHKCMCEVLFLSAFSCFDLLWLGLIYKIFTGSWATEIFIALMETLIRINRAEDSPLTTRTALLADVSDK